MSDLGFGIVIGVSLTIYFSVLIILYIEKLRNKQREKEIAANYVKNHQNEERKKKLQSRVFNMMYPIPAYKTLELG